MPGLSSAPNFPVTVVAECWFYNSHSPTIIFRQISSSFMFTTQVGPGKESTKHNSHPMWSKESMCHSCQNTEGFPVSSVATASHNPTVLCAELLLPSLWSAFICTSGTLWSRWVGHFNDFGFLQIISPSKTICVKGNPLKQHFGYISTSSSLFCWHRSKLIFVNAIPHSEKQRLSTKVICCHFIKKTWNKSFKREFSCKDLTF